MFITVRNEVAKVMFLQVCVCPRGGGGGLPQCMLGYQPPGPGTPESRHPPPGRDVYCCGRYASYWNAFLLLTSLKTKVVKQKETLWLIQLQTEQVSRLTCEKIYHSQYCDPFCHSQGHSFIMLNCDLLSFIIS